MNDQLAELDRLTTDFASTIREQSKRMESGLRSLSGALDQAASRLAAVIPGAAATGGGGTPGAGAAEPAAVGVAGAVRVINDPGSPIPVTVVNAPAQQQRRGGILGFLGDVASGLGAVAGGILGGIFGGLARPVLSVVAGAELIILARQLAGLAERVQRILDTVDRILKVVVASVRGLIELLFRELTAAGIFPVSRLIASLLFLIDRGITLVLAHIQPIIEWAQRLLEYAVTWAGAFLGTVSAFLTALLNTVTAHLASFVTYLLQWVVKPALADLLETVVRPAVAVIVRDAIRALVDALASVLLGTFFAFGNVIKSAFVWGAQWIAHAVTDALSFLPGVSASAKPGAFDIGKIITEGFDVGKFLGGKLATGLLGPPPSPGSRAIPGVTGPAPAPPKLRLPTLKAPALELPRLPTPEPLLEKIMKPPEAPPAPEAAGGPPVTVNGGLSVQVTAQTVDMENADATARVLASHVLDELNRLVERDRFRRGLPTTMPA